MINYAMALAETYGLRGYDAVQLATGCSINNLCTASPVKVFFIQELFVNFERQRSSREKLGNSTSKLRPATVAVLFDF